MRMTKKKKILKIVVGVLLALVLLVIVGWGVFCSYVYDSNLNVRCDTKEENMLHVENYDGLSCKEYSFTSNKGQKLAGYLYSAGDEQRGIVIIAHGYGGGHNSYMDVANYFAQNGYYVFAYDATGCDKSEGDGIGAAPQGVVDLEHAISFVEDNEEIPDLPIVLWGHSWGGYSSCNVLTYHPEVKAVIECAGFNKSSDMFESFGRRTAGEVIDYMMPFIKLHELIHYGKYARNTALDGFAASDAHVMVVHSTDDDVIGMEYSYDVFYENHKDDPNFVFVKFETRGHNHLYDDPAKKDLDRRNGENRLDQEMFKDFVEFYDEAIGE
ncbi:hypothetical protein SAMN05421493_10442 [Pseudobutyrivibrio sp. 49]|nr:hypothetical protein SAMN05421493_10442 [Pseudobutyrivibrio sp. 49]SFO01638.1 hypothetical protein SAMN04487831_10640 [Pseudobutyrivibrio sp. UC1225]